MSGPAILKLSSFGARLLYDKGYQFNVQINWLYIKNEQMVNELLDFEFQNIRKKKITNANLFSLPNRMWLFLLQKVHINSETRWMELTKKNRNKLINVLINDIYTVSGKTTFKSEFLPVVELISLMLTSVLWKVVFVRIFILRERFWILMV